MTYILLEIIKQLISASQHWFDCCNISLNRYIEASICKNLPRQNVFFIAKIRSEMLLMSIEQCIVKMYTCINGYRLLFVILFPTCFINVFIISRCYKLLIILIISFCKKKVKTGTKVNTFSKKKLKKKIWFLISIQLYNMWDCIFAISN